MPIVHLREWRRGPAEGETPPSMLTQNGGVQVRVRIHQGSTAIVCSTRRVPDIRFARSGLSKPQEKAKSQEHFCRCSEWRGVREASFSFNARRTLPHTPKPNKRKNDIMTSGRLRRLSLAQGCVTPKM
ncbi:unnamed protein product [Ectocarpus sp. 12 AP-2014]